MKKTAIHKTNFLLCAIFTAFVLIGCICQLFTIGIRENLYFVLDTVRFLSLCSTAVILFSGKETCEPIGFINENNAWLIWLLCCAITIFLFVIWICFLCRKKWAGTGLFVMLSADMVFLIVQYFWLERWFGIANMETLDRISFAAKIFGLLLFGIHIALQHPKKDFAPQQTE